MPKIVPNILFVYLSPDFGDDEQLALEDIFELNANDIQWKMLCLKGSPIHQRIEQFGRTHVVAIDKAPSENFDRGMQEILNEHVRSGINVIHVFGSNYLGSILPWLIRHRNVSVVISEGPRVKKSIWHFLQSFFYSRIDAVVVPSIALKKRIQTMRPALAHKLRVVHAGLDFNIFNPDHFDFTVLRNQWGIDSNYYLVGMIASPEYVKAQSAFIKAAASFLRNAELAKRTKFVIVGFVHEGNEELIELIKTFHLQEQIILVPFEESVPKVSVLKNGVRVLSLSQNFPSLVNIGITFK